MSLVTLTSDFGYQDHYVAAVKAAVLKLSPGATIVDISHGIEPANIAQGAYTLQAVYHEFPLGTVHIFTLQNNQPTSRHIAFQWAGHYFIGSDNGFVGLLTEEDVEQCVEIKPMTRPKTTFLAQVLYAPAAAQLSRGVPLQKIGTPCAHLQRLIPRKPAVTGNQIRGHVIHVDHYGNLITNITQGLFEQQSLGNRFEICFARESIRHLHSCYTEVEPGDCVCMFNSLAQLEIAINQGHAATLLGMQYDSSVCISFYS